MAVMIKTNTNNASKKVIFYSLSIGRYGAAASIHCVMDELVSVSSSLPERLNKYTAKPRCSATAKACVEPITVNAVAHASAIIAEPCTTVTETRSC